MTKKEEQEFNEWFESLTLEEQEEYFADMEAQAWVDEYKSNDFYPEE